MASDYSTWEEREVLGSGAGGTARLLRGPMGEMVVSKQVDIVGLPADEAAKVRQEIQILASLQHASIVAYLGSFERPSKLSIVMEFADGGSLAEVLSAQTARGAPFATETVCRWLTQLSSALLHVHSRRVLHRDIKPENIFLSEAPMSARLGSAARDVKLGDFGISRVLSSKSNLAATVLGTPFYLSPELVWGKRYNEASDAWALGVVAFQLMALRRPFEAPNLGALVLRIANSAPSEDALAALASSPHPQPLQWIASADGASRHSIERPSQSRRKRVAISFAHRQRYEGLLH